MPELSTETCGRIRDLGAKIGAMDPHDRDTLVVLGAGLEEAANETPREMAGLRDLLYLCLQCLQKTYEEGGKGCANVIEAVASALGLAGNLPADADAASSEIAKARDRLAAKLEAPCPTLDAIAASLIQIEPGDIEGLRRVGSALREVRASLPAEVHGTVDRAIAVVTRVCDQGLGDGSVLSELGTLVEQAMCGVDRTESGEQSAAPKPTAAGTEAAASSAPPAECLGSSGSQEALADMDPGLVSEFVTESSEYIQGAEACLLALEANPGDMEAVRTVFRAFHTIKGTSAFLGFDLVSEFAHRAETLLSRIRDGEIRYGGGYADLALRSIDMLKDLLRSVEAYAPGKPLRKPDSYEQLLGILANPEAAGYSSGTVDAQAQKTDTQACQAGGAGAAPAAAGPTGGEAPKPGTANETAESMRVSTERLDQLIDMVGELVIANSMVVQDVNVSDTSDHDLTRKVAQMAKIVRELQDHSMSMRMIPLKGTFQKMARVVRDVARKSGKSVKFASDGGETEMDRNMVDVINDPLVHMLRNAVDHGIEAPDVRERNGKPREGTVAISAYHSGGSVVIEITDDGRGISRDGVIKKALEKGLIQQDQVLSDSEVFGLIFEPGFSTAEKVTSVSGRGVGLDVVKKGLDALRGRIEVRSEPGKGCTFLLRLPLTMAIIDGMVVRVGGERYIVSALSVVRSLRPERSAISTILEGGEVLALDGNLLPLVRLGSVFAVAGAATDPTQAIVLVVEGEGRRAALMVDELLGKQQIVIKSLGKTFGEVKGISGGAIMPDGRVGLIIDVSGLLALAETCGAAEAITA